MLMELPDACVRVDVYFLITSVAVNYGVFEHGNTDRSSFFFCEMFRSELEVVQKSGSLDTMPTPSASFHFLLGISNGSL